MKSRLAFLSFIFTHLLTYTPLLIPNATADELETQLYGVWRGDLDETLAHYQKNNLNLPLKRRGGVELVSFEFLPDGRMQIEFDGRKIRSSYEIVQRELNQNRLTVLFMISRSAEETRRVSFTFTSSEEAQYLLIAPESAPNDQHPVVLRRLTSA